MFESSWKTVWLLLVTFSNSDRVNITTFETRTQCEAQLEAVRSSLMGSPDVRSVECVEGATKLRPRD